MHTCRKGTLFAVLLPILLLGCGSDEPGAGAAAPDARAARAEIDRLRSDWIEAAERDDAEAVAGYYAEDAVVVTTANPEPARGREAIQRMWAEGFPAVSETEVRSSEFVAGGDVAYDYGEYTQRVSPPNGEPITERGHYLVALRRQPDGTWKIAKHVAVASSPAGAPAPASPR